MLEDGVSKVAAIDIKVTTYDDGVTGSCQFCFEGNESREFLYLGKLSKNTSLIPFEIGNYVICLGVGAKKVYKTLVYFNFGKNRTFCTHSINIIKSIENELI